MAGKAFGGLSLSILRSVEAITNRQRFVTWRERQVRSGRVLHSRFSWPHGRISRSANVPGVVAHRPRLAGCNEAAIAAYNAVVFAVGYGVIQLLLAALEKKRTPRVAQVPGNIVASPAGAVASLDQSGPGCSQQHAKAEYPAVRPPSTPGCRDLLLAEPARWQKRVSRLSRRNKPVGRGRARSNLPAQESLAPTRNRPLGFDRATWRRHFQVSPLPSAH